MPRQRWRWRGIRPGTRCGRRAAHLSPPRGVPRLPVLPSACCRRAWWRSCTRGSRASTTARRGTRRSRLSPRRPPTWMTSPTLRRDLDHVGRASRPTDDEYARYISSRPRTATAAIAMTISSPCRSALSIHSSTHCWLVRTSVCRLARMAEQPSQHHLERAASLSAALHDSCTTRISAATSLSMLGPDVAVGPHRRRPGPVPPRRPSADGSVGRCWRTLTGPSFLVIPTSAAFRATTSRLPISICIVTGAGRRGSTPTG